MRREGFSVIELLIAMLIVGIIAAIAMGNYFNGGNRAKQKRIMADIRALAAAAAYAIRSPGRDGLPQGNQYQDGPTTNYECDIV